MFMVLDAYRIKLEKYMNKYSDRQHRIIEILLVKNAEFVDTLKKIESLEELSEEIRESIINILSDEYIEKGIDENSEPNRYGLEVEELIDFVNNKKI